jgi:hypothetical protein
MKTRHSSQGISRAAAEQLLDGRTATELVLDGQADPGTDQLARVLAAASAPARDVELAGELMAVAAFAANHLPTSATPQKKEHTSMLGKIFTAKVIFSSLAAFATGGVALAASTGALTSPHHPTTAVSSPATPAAIIAPSYTPTTAPSTFPSAPASQPAPQPTGTSSTGAPSAQPSASPSASTLPQTAAGLCTALAGDLDSVTGSTLSPASLVSALSKSSLGQTVSKDSSEFSSLVSTAGSVTNVSDYCALLLDLPQLPDPSQLAQLPSTVLGQLLSALPTSALTQLLNTLPSSVLSQVLAELPSSLLSQLPTSLLGQL